MEDCKVRHGKKLKKERSASEKPLGTTLKRAKEVNNTDRSLTTGNNLDIQRDGEIEDAEILLQQQNLLKRRDLHPHTEYRVIPRLKKSLNDMEEGMYRKGQESPELRMKPVSSQLLGKKDDVTPKEYLVHRIAKDGRSSKGTSSHLTDSCSTLGSGIQVPPQPEQMLAQDNSFVPEFLHEKVESAKSVCDSTVGTFDSNHSARKAAHVAPPKFQKCNKTILRRHDDTSEISQEGGEKHTTLAKGKTSEIIVSGRREVMKVKSKGNVGSYPLVSHEIGELALQNHNILVRDLLGPAKLFIPKVYVDNDACEVYSAEEDVQVIIDPYIALRSLLNLEGHHSPTFLEFIETWPFDCDDFDVIFLLCSVNLFEWLYCLTVAFVAFVILQIT